MLSRRPRVAPSVAALLYSYGDALQGQPPQGQFDNVWDVCKKYMTIRQETSCPHASCMSWMPVLCELTEIMMSSVPLSSFQDSQNLGLNCMLPLARRIQTTETVTVRNHHQDPLRRTTPPQTPPMEERCSAAKVRIPRTENCLFLPVANFVATFQHGLRSGHCCNRWH